MNFNLEKFLTPYHPKQVGRDEVVINCPICGKEKLTINIQKQLWHCWVCQEFKTGFSGKRIPVKGAGNIVSLVALLQGIDYKQALQIVKKEESNTTGEVQRSSFLQEIEGLSKVDLFSIKEIAYPEYATSINQLLPYCLLRGISLLDVDTFRLFYCYKGRYNNRLIFPVYEGGRLVYYQARAMFEDGGSVYYKKCLNPPNLDGMNGSSFFLFNLDKACVYPRVVVTEGPIDAIHCGEMAVCTFGKKISYVQILKLWQFGVRAIDLLWDGPTEKEPFGAYFEMGTIASLLSLLFDVRVVYLPWGDPGDYTRDQLDIFRNQYSISANKVSRLSYI
ncbi:MAG: hypothetical protein JW702_09140 [Clostridiales bacterium]|nr:hypothetical protein [Clostridiales bacterium]